MQTKTNKEIILEILEECSRPNEEEKEDFGIFDIKDTVKEIVEKAKRSIVKKDPHYRMSMKKMISTYIWANLNKPGKGLVPVIGNYQNKIDGHCNLARGTMAKFTGIKSTMTIDTGLKSLVNEGVITKKETRRCNEYFLTTRAKWFEAIDEGTTYFRLYRKDVGYWAKLKPCEKAMYPVLFVKGTMEDPEIVDDPDIICKGYIDEIKKYLDWAGIKRCAYKKVIEGLKAKGLIDIEGWSTPRGEVTYIGTYYLYKLDTIYQEKDKLLSYE
ncbi:hypothetical protein ES705_41591 [subsurface metagenome]